MLDRWSARLIIISNNVINIHVNMYCMHYMCNAYTWTTTTDIMPLGDFLFYRRNNSARYLNFYSSMTLAHIFTTLPFKIRRRHKRTLKQELAGTEVQNRRTFRASLVTLKLMPLTCSPRLLMLAAKQEGGVTQRQSLKYTESLIFSEAVHGVKKFEKYCSKAGTSVMFGI